MSRGVAAGANMPNHIGITKLSMPASFEVGTSGSVGARCSDSTASARTLPARICGNADATATTTSSTSPPIKENTATEAPLYGTWTRLIFSRLISSSLAR